MFDAAADADHVPVADHRRMWALGDYAQMTDRLLAPIGPAVVAAAGIGPGDRVLDVAAGSGSVAIPAAMTGAEVIATDLTPELLERGRARADEHAVPMQWQVADAQALPFPDAHFDAVLSGIGVMFAPDQQLAADELARVCRPGGRIALANWTPDGFYGRLLTAIRPYRSTQLPGVPPAALWGRVDYVASLLGGWVNRMVAERRLLRVDGFESPAAVRDYFKHHYGPAIDAYATIAGNAALTAVLDAELAELAEQYLHGDAMDWEYLLMVAER